MRNETFRAWPWPNEHYLLHKESQRVIWGWLYLLLENCEHISWLPGATDQMVRPDGSNVTDRWWRMAWFSTGAVLFCSLGILFPQWVSISHARRGSENRGSP